MSNRRKLLDKLRSPQSANELLVARVTGLALITVVIDLLVAFAFYRLDG